MKRFATLSLLRVLLLSVLWPLFWIALPTALILYSTWRATGHADGFSLLGVWINPNGRLAVAAFLLVPPLIMIGAWYIARRWAR
jgi:hypothetical protein